MYKITVENTIFGITMNMYQDKNLIMNLKSDDKDHGFILTMVTEDGKFLTDKEKIMLLSYQIYLDRVQSAIRQGWYKQIHMDETSISNLFSYYEIDNKYRSLFTYPGDLLIIATFINQVYYDGITHLYDEGLKLNSTLEEILYPNLQDEEIKLLHQYLRSNLSDQKLNYLRNKQDELFKDDYSKRFQFNIFFNLNMSERYINNNFFNLVKLILDHEFFGQTLIIFNKYAKDLNEDELNQMVKLVIDIGRTTGIPINFIRLDKYDNILSSAKNIILKNEKVDPIELIKEYNLIKTTV